MKTNIKLELALLAFVSILSLIFQVHVRTTSNSIKAEIIALSESLPTSQVEITDFTRIKNTIDIPVEIYTGPAHLEVKTDQQLLDALDISTEEGRLIIDYKEKNNKRGSNELIGASLIRIYSPSALKTIELDGNAKATIKDIAIDSSFVVELDGNSRLTGEVNTKEIEAESSGNSTLAINGSTQFLQVKSSGNSHMDMSAMKSQNAKVHSSGNSGGTIFSQKSLDAKLSGNSQYEILGNPEKTQVISNGNSHVDIKE